MIKFRLNINLDPDDFRDKDFILQMLCLYTEHGSDKKYTKKEFLSYMKDQVYLFGVDDHSQFGEKYRENGLSKCLFKKWFSKKTYKVDLYMERPKNKDKNKSPSKTVMVKASSNYKAIEIASRENRGYRYFTASVKG